jgi:hypothetical protein
LVKVLDRPLAAYHQRSTHIINEARGGIGCMNSKRRRRNVPKVAFDTLELSWASVHEDLVRLIAWRVLVGDFLDYACFRAVCSC